jgi:hypothetical protein
MHVNYMKRCRFCDLAPQSELNEDHVHNFFLDLEISMFLIVHSLLDDSPVETPPRHFADTTGLKRRIGTYKVQPIIAPNTRKKFNHI